MKRRYLKLLWIWFLVGVAFVYQSLACPLAQKEAIQYSSQEINYSQAYAQIYRFVSQYRYPQTSDQKEKVVISILEYSAQKNLDPYLLTALMARESSFNPQAVSKTGAKGLGQIKDFHYSKYHINDPFDIHQNIRGSVALLTDLRSAWKGEHEWESKFDTDALILSSYFIGLGATQRSEGVLPVKAQNYIKDIFALREKNSLYLTDLLNSFSKLI